MSNIYEGKKYENHELEQLIEDLKEYFERNPDILPDFRAKVESNPFGKGGEQELWFCVFRNGFLDSCFPKQRNINGVDYGWIHTWTDGKYKGSITITELPKQLT